MTIRWPLIVLFLASCATLAFAQSNSLPPSACDAPYALYLGHDAPIAGVTLFADGDFLYIGGARQQQPIVIKTNLQGDVLWQTALMPIEEGAAEITDLRPDSEGMLIGCGIARPGGLLTGFAFRLNPANGQLLWSRRYIGADGAGIYPADIYEIAPGGNYMLMGGANDNPAPGYGCDAMLYALDRQSGAIAAPALHYNLGSCENFSAAIYENGIFYATGRYNFAESGLDRMRPPITAFDPTGTPIWSRLYLTDVNTNARLYGSDIVKQGNQLLILIHGDAQGVESATANLWLLQANLAGSAMWAKRLAYPEVVSARELIPAPGGFFILAEALNSPNLYLTRTDANGAPLWTRRLPGLNTASPFGDEAVWSQNHLYLTAAESGRLVLLRLDADGNLPTHCVASLPADVTAHDLLSVYDGFHQLTLYNAPTLSGPSFTQDSLNATWLPQSCSPPCGNEICGNDLDDDGDGLTDCADPDLQADCCCAPLPSLNLGPDTTLCEGQSLALAVSPGFSQWSWSDGSTDTTLIANAPGLYWLSARDSCGRVQTDSLLLSFNLPAPGLFSERRICPGDTLLFGGQTITSAGVYLAPAGLCQRPDTLSVSLWQPSISTDTLALCPGENLLWEGQTLAAPGLYARTYTDRNGCDSLRRAWVTLGQPVNTRQTLRICQGQSAVIFGQTVAQPGLYTRTFTAAGGCDSVHTIQLIVETLTLEVAIFYTCTGNQGIVAAAIVEGGTGPYTYAWTVRGGEDGNVDNLDPGIYGVTVTSASGCSVSTLFTVEEDPGYYLAQQPGQASALPQPETRQAPAPSAASCYFPNAFSPNADGANDGFTGYGGVDVLQILSLEVFDAGGRRVFLRRHFAPNIETLGWDGAIRGLPAPPGLYHFRAAIQLSDGAAATQTGALRLLR
jgi:hypothetical protein